MIKYNDYNPVPYGLDKKVSEMTGDELYKLIYSAVLQANKTIDRLLKE